VVAITECKNVDQVKTSLGDLGLDYTLYFADGSWKDQRQSSLIIELDNTTKDIVEKAAKLIKQIKNQEKMMLQEIPVTSQSLQNFRLPRRIQYQVTITSTIPSTAL
jgi:hypothetical protein